jgi:hypothetical protein
MKRNDELGHAEFTIQSPLGATGVTLTPQSCQLTPADVWRLTPAGKQYGGMVILDPQDSYAEKAGQTSLQIGEGSPPDAAVRAAITGGLADAIRSWIAEHPEAPGTASRAVTHHAIRRMRRELDRAIDQVHELRDQIEAAEQAAEPPAGTLVWATHSNDIGDWCPWSGEPVADFSDEDDAMDSETCPAGCRGSWADEK